MSTFDPTTSEIAYFIALDGEPVSGPYWSMDAAQTGVRIALQYGEIHEQDDYEIAVLPVEP